MENNAPFLKFEDGLYDEYGKYKVCFKTNKYDYLIAIGPHWYISVITVLLIFGFGLFLYIHFLNLVTPTISNLYLFVFLLTILMYCVAILTNPGIIPKKRGLEIEDRSPYVCLKCFSLKNQKAFHCEDCDVCIEGFDHHCIFMGKCVGKNNFAIFSLFSISIPVFFFATVILACIATGHSIKSN